MIIKLIKLIWILAGLFCLLALADRWDWTRQLWEKVFPEVILVRRPSPSEAQISELGERIDALKQQIVDKEKGSAGSTAKRLDLLAELRERIGINEPDIVAERLMNDDPIAAALIKSIDAEDRMLVELEHDITERRSKLTRLQARVIALQNGVSQVNFVESDRPSDELRTENNGETDSNRYQRIIREVTKFIH